MRKQTDKKLISFTKLPLIEKLVKDEADIQNRSESAIIENRLLNSFLPAEENARFYAEIYLYNDCGENNIKATLSAIFGFNAAGARGPFTSRYDNLRPFVEFARSESVFCNTRPTGKEVQLHHFCSALDSVCCILEQAANGEGSTLVTVQEAVHYGQCAKYARELLREAKEEPQYMRYINFYTLVLDAWDVLKGSTWTFRMLTDLADMELGWRNTPETRKKLLQILNEVSSEWD